MTQVILTPQAQKDLKKIPLKEKLKIHRKLTLLKTDPFLGKRLKGKLKGYFSLRIWPYRAIYVIINKTVWIVHITHRQQAY